MVSLLRRRALMVQAATPSLIEFSDITYNQTYYKLSVSDGNHFTIKPTRRNYGAYVFINSASSSNDSSKPVFLNLVDGDTVKVVIRNLTVTGTVRNNPSIACALLGEESSQAFGWIMTNNNSIPISSGSLGDFVYEAVSDANNGIYFVRLYIYADARDVGSATIEYDLEVHINGIRRI